MPEPEINIAVAALVISLVALVVTTQQLLVQIFGSADGYRQCAESVIGSWHKRRKRIWIWSEFRFETQYVTPQIALLTSTEFLDMFEEYDEVCTINGTSAKRTIKKGSMVREIRGFDPKELIGTVHGRFSQMQNRSRARRKKSDHELEKGTHLSPPNKAGAKERIGMRNDTSVTWLRLLSELHNLSNSYWPRDCATCSADIDVESPLPESAIETGISTYRSFKSHPELHSVRTMVCIVYRTWNWGFMPPDLTRPLAEISLGDIVILALRMGMQWRVLDLESGKMQADGNGFNLTGFEARGLGIILRLTATEKQSEYRKLLPTRAVDKMLFGILPGDPHLVKMDFPLIKKDFSLQSFTDPQGILSAIMSRESREKLGDVEALVRVDVITLLATYLPIEGCLMTRYCFPGWVSNSSNQSVYTFWEGRLALHRALQARVEEGRPALHGEVQASTEIPNSVNPKVASVVLDRVLECFKWLEQDYKDDWYVRWSKPRVMRNQQGVEAKKKCMKTLRDIYEWTQEWLTTNVEVSKRPNAPTYTDLVASHAYMATHACRATQHRNPADPAYHGPDGRYVLLIPDYDEEKHGFRPDDNTYAIACNYVNHLNHNEHGMHAYLRDNHLDMSVEDCEAAWWVMQLRGIVWHLSTWHGDTIVRDVLGEQLIPSSFYGNKSPIWIT
jgi:hypothetical protein